MLTMTITMSPGLATCTSKARQYYIVIVIRGFPSDEILPKPYRHQCSEGLSFYYAESCVQVWFRQLTFKGLYCFHAFSVDRYRGQHIGKECVFSTSPGDPRSLQWVPGPLRDIHHIRCLQFDLPKHILRRSNLGNFQAIFHRCESLNPPDKNMGF